MFHRPRCRDWTPLITQQLRLRNLIKITGHNIVCDTSEKCCIYFTLHLTSMSAPFFTSDMLDPHANIMWSDIDCPMLYKSAATSVCIRIWQHIQTKQEADEERQMQLRRPAQNHAGDKILFLWGVYFSGLVQLENVAEKLIENSLIFHMHGGYFTAEKCLAKPDPPANPRQFISQSYNPVMTWLNEGKANGDDSTFEIIGNALNHIAANSFSDFNSKCDIRHTMGSHNASAIDIPKRLTTNPPNYKNFHNQPTLRVRTESMTSTTSTASSTAMGGDKEWYRHSAGTIYAPATAEVAASCKNKRFLSLEFSKCEIRPSYSVKQLLRLQQIQREIKNRVGASNELTEQICMKSAYCLNLDLIANKPFVYRPKVYPGMGRTLSRLLQSPPPTPEVLLKGQQLRRKIEDERFRCKILLQERDRKKALIRQLNTRLGVITDANFERASVIMSQYHQLNKDKEAFGQQLLSYAGQKGMLSRVKSALHQRRLELLHELNVIYEIKKPNDRGPYTINNVPLPDAESYVTEAVTPTNLSVALGFAAHSVLMCATILDIPLRNPIVYDGSRSKIVDAIKLLPPSDKESSPPPNTLLYAVFLLNQNISQLKYLMRLSRGDLRATLQNLFDLINAPAPAQDVTDGHKKYADDLLCPVSQSLSGSSSLDLQPVVPYHALLKNDGPRISRSFDDEHRFLTKHGKFSSEPILNGSQIERCIIGEEERV